MWRNSGACGEIPGLLAKSRGLVAKISGLVANFRGRVAKPRGLWRHLGGVWRDLGGLWRNPSGCFLVDQCFIHGGCARPKRAKREIVKTYLLHESRLCRTALIHYAKNIFETVPHSVDSFFTTYLAQDEGSQFVGDVFARKRFNVLQQDHLAQSKGEYDTKSTALFSRCGGS